MLLCSIVMQIPLKSFIWHFSHLIPPPHRSFDFFLIKRKCPSVILDFSMSSRSVRKFSNLDVSLTHKHTTVDRYTCRGKRLLLVTFHLTFLRNCTLCRHRRLNYIVIVIIIDTHLRQLPGKTLDNVTVM
jgi:hypothetical protein